MGKMVTCHQDCHLPATRVRGSLPSLRISSKPHPLPGICILKSSAASWESAAGTLCPESERRGICEPISVVLFLRFVSCDEGRVGAAKLE